jgi:hypothetical protein
MSGGAGICDRTRGDGGVKDPRDQAVNPNGGHATLVILLAGATDRPADDCGGGSLAPVTADSCAAGNEWRTCESP